MSTPADLMGGAPPKQLPGARRVSIRPQWTIGGSGGTVLAERTVALLVGVAEHGSLLRACQAMRVSYRHAWSLVRQGEALLGAPLLRMERGRGSTLSPLAEKLVWADRRIAARLSPMLDSLASELQAEIDRLLPTELPLLRIHASHGFAIEAMHLALAAAGMVTALRYCGSIEAVASLGAGECDVAGLHVPVGELEAAAVSHYVPWLKPATQRVIGVATRRVGLMVAAGDPKKIYGLPDLTRPDVHFINRQPGSGTRFLLDLLLHKAGLSPADLRGYEHCELTHAAVAAYVASGLADVGFGVETPARQFRLDFVPLQTERYVLLCDERSLALPAMGELIGLLRSEAFRATVNRLPGYQAGETTGAVSGLAEVWPSIGGRRGKPRSGV